MAVTNPPTMKSIIATFGGPNNLRAYARDGGYVPTNGTTTNISTNAGALTMRQFSGADKTTTSPTTLSAAGSPISATKRQESTASTVEGSVQLYPGGGNGSYSISASVLSSTVVTSPAARTSGYTGYGSGFISAVGQGNQRSGTVVVRFTATSAGTSAYTDVTFSLTHRNTELPSCVSVLSIVNPLTRQYAGDVDVNQALFITDPYAMEVDVDRGAVQKSETHTVPCVRFITESGAYLDCSESAPIPTETAGYVLAVDLIGHAIPAIDRSALADERMDAMFWDRVVEVQSIGEHPVQLIYVNDRAFWASMDGETYFLHHNAKNIF